MNFFEIKGLNELFLQVDTAPYEVRAKYKNHVGMGLTPEGLYNSYVMYELMMETFLRQESIKDISQWFQNYSNRRYGLTDSNLENAWKSLAASVFDCCHRLNTTKPFRNRRTFILDFDFSTVQKSRFK